MILDDFHLRPSIWNWNCWWFGLFSPWEIHFDWGIYREYVEKKWWFLKKIHDNYNWLVIVSKIIPILDGYIPHHCHHPFGIILETITNQYWRDDILGNVVKKCYYLHLDVYDYDSRYHGCICSIIFYFCLLSHCLSLSLFMTKILYVYFSGWLTRVRSWNSYSSATLLPWFLG